MMKNILLFISILVSVFSCSSIDDPISNDQYISIILTKDNVKETFRIEDSAFIQGAIYFHNDSLDYTSISLINESGAEPHHLSIAFPGNQVRTIDWSNSQWNLIVIIKNEGGTIVPIYVPYNGYTDITKYGSIGERVEGTISGILVEMATRDTLSVQGEFSVVRRPDYELEL